MKTIKMQLIEAVNMPDAPLPLRAARVTWENLTILLCADLLLGLACLPPVLTWLAGWQLLAPWVATLTLGPAWAATCALADRLTSEEAATWSDLLRAGQQHWWTAVRVSAMPALGATLLLGTWSILHAYPHTGWLYLPLFLDGCVAMLIFLACLAAFPLSITRGLRGLNLWKVALALTALRPGASLALAALLGGISFVLLYFQAGWLFVLYAPLAVYLVMLTDQTCKAVMEHETSV